MSASGSKLTEHRLFIRRHDPRAAAAPGLSSLLHDQLSKDNVLNHSLEINSNSGICYLRRPGDCQCRPGSQIRGFECSGLCWESNNLRLDLKSKAFRTTYDIPVILKDCQKSKWFMSVFLRFMLSDGAGAFLLRNKPNEKGLSLKVDWTYSRSFANEAPLCMQLQSHPMDVESGYFYSGQIHGAAVQKSSGGCIMQKRRVAGQLHYGSASHVILLLRTGRQERSWRNFPESEVPYWTNLGTAGNTGAASIFIMLDEYMKTKPVASGDRILLFVPESGQFNYVLISLTVV